MSTSQVGQRYRQLAKNTQIDQVYANLTMKQAIQTYNGYLTSNSIAILPGHFERLYLPLEMDRHGYASINIRPYDYLKQDTADMLKLVVHNERYRCETNRRVVITMLIICVRCCDSTDIVSYGMSGLQLLGAEIDEPSSYDHINDLITTKRLSDAGIEHEMIRHRII